LLQEWCEKQMEFVLERGKPEKTAAMRVGSDRHAQLEQEVTQHFWLFQVECWAFSATMKVSPNESHSDLLTLGPGC
jgi:hypothetical protein